MSNITNRFFYYEPSQNIEEVLPYLILIGVFILASVGTWACYSLYIMWQNETLAWKRFHVLARRYTLNPREEAYLKRIVKNKNYRNPNRILVEEDRFESMFAKLEEKGRDYDKRYIRSIREKLFHHSLSEGETIRSTHQLHPGTRLNLRPEKENQSFTFDCYLANVDNNGLLVVVPATHRKTSEIRPDSTVEVTVNFPKHKTVQFLSKVKSCIPGPRKMILLAHTTYVIDLNPLVSPVQNLN